MKTSKLITLALLSVSFGLLCSCTTDKLMGMVVPAPNTKPNSGSIPDGDPFDPDKPTPPTPPGPDDPMEKIVNNPDRLARIGITPMIEIYYTEYTKADWFPSLEEVKSTITHVNIGHVRFKDKDNGTGIEIPAASISLVEKFVGYKHNGYPELKVKLQMGGWGKNADGWSQMARDPQKRKDFIDECVAICNQYDIDGFDIDWEYPTYQAKDGDHVNAGIPEDYQNFITLLKEMREAMPTKILSYAASSSGKYTDNVNALKYVDYINVMTYDEGNPPYHNAPLYRSSIASTRTCQEAIDDIFHGQQGIPYQMMNFGVPFYGHGDGYKDQSGNAVYPRTVNYDDLEDIFFNDTCDGKSVKGKNYRVWDDVAKVPYLADALGRMYASYEDIESVNAKVEFLKSRNMLGAMIWEFREDNKEGILRHAVKHAMDGNPDAPGRYERPEEQITPQPKELPVMGQVTTKKLTGLSELSGLCLSKDGDFLWGVADGGYLFKIQFDFTFQEALPHDKFYGGKYFSESAQTYKDYWYDLEGITMNPDNGDLYIAYEPDRVIRIKAPAYDTVEPKLFDVAEADDLGNSGIEGITWYKGGLYLGCQDGAKLWRYSTDGNMLQETIRLRNVTNAISEVADLCYDPVSDYLWIITSEGPNANHPERLPYTLFLFSGDASKCLATYDLSSFTKNNPEAVCVDRANSCLWIADDASNSILHKVHFDNL